jgi:hypothetical protein
MDTGAVVAVTLQEAHLGDTTTVKETLAEAGTTVTELIEREAAAQPLEKPQVNLGGIEEVNMPMDEEGAPTPEELRGRPTYPTSLPHRTTSSG